MRLLPLTLLLAGCVLVIIPACKPRVDDEAEIQRRVEERLAERQQADLRRQLHERAAELDAREQDIRAREEKLAAATPVPPRQDAPVAEQLAVEPPPAEQQQQQPAPAPNGVPRDSDANFFNLLAPYGAWLEVPGYGDVWQPRESAENPHWRPYTDGHWAYTDSGWTWISDEPFGWITYHYGRWMRTHQLNWVWVPDNQWAPAWVSWRYGNDYVGWAPLPPGVQAATGGGGQPATDEQYDLGPSDYTFVPASDFGDDRMADVAVPSEQVQPIYDDSTNVTNIIYYNSYTVACFGPDFDFMRSRSRRSLAHLRVNRVGFAANGQNGATVSNGTLQITAPVLKKAPAGVAPRGSARHIADTRVVSIPPAGLGNTGRPPAPGRTGGTAPRQPPAGVAGGATGLHIPSQMKPVPLSPALQQLKEEDRQREAALAAEAARERAAQRFAPAPAAATPARPQPPASLSAQQEDAARAVVQRAQQAEAAQEQQEARNREQAAAEQEPEQARALEARAAAPRPQRLQEQPPASIQRPPVSQVQQQQQRQQQQLREPVRAPEPARVDDAAAARAAAAQAALHQQAQAASAAAPAGSPGRR